MIYLMQAKSGGPVKIGHSADVERRREELEAHYGCLLAVLATLPGGPEEEAEIHGQFHHLRLKGKRDRGRPPEQFRPTAELMAFIGRPLLVGANPDTVEIMEPQWTASKPLVLQMRGSEEWKAWVEEAAKFNRITVASLVDQAVSKFVRESGFPKEPPER